MMRHCIDKNNLPEYSPLSDTRSYTPSTCVPFDVYGAFDTYPSLTRSLILRSEHSFQRYLDVAKTRHRRGQKAGTYPHRIFDYESSLPNMTNAEISRELMRENLLSKGIIDRKHEAILRKKKDKAVLDKRRSRSKNIDRDRVTHELTASFMDAMSLRLQRGHAPRGGQKKRHKRKYHAQSAQSGPIYELVRGKWVPVPFIDNEGQMFSFAIVPGLTGCEVTVATVGHVPHYAEHEFSPEQIREFSENAWKLLEETSPDIEEKDDLSFVEEMMTKILEFPKYVQKMAKEAFKAALMLFSSFRAISLIDFTASILQYLTGLFETIPASIMTLYYKLKESFSTFITDYSEHLPSMWRRFDDEVVQNDYHAFDEKEDDDYQAQGEVAEGVSSATNIVLAFFSSGLIQTFKELILAAVSFRWFSKDVSRSLTRWLGKPHIYTMFGVVEQVFGSLTTLIRFGESWAQGVPFNELLMGDSPFQAIIDRAKYLISWSDRLYTGLPMLGRKCRVEWMSDTADCLKAGQTLLDNGASTWNSMRRPLRVCIDELNLVYASKLELIGAMERVPPVGVILHGDPGIGKSKLLSYICQIWSTAKGRKYDPSHMYTRDKTSDYWEQYLPSSQPIIHYSEVGNKSRDSVKSGGDNILAELNSLIDGTPFNCTMAFGQKGTVFASPELVVVDTNNPTMHVETLMHAPAAIKRRFTYVHPTVRTEFRRDGSSALDSAKSVAAGGLLLDRYTFVIYEYIVVDNKNATKKVLLSGGNLVDMTNCLLRLFEHRIELGERMGDLEDVTVSDVLNHQFVEADEEDLKEFMEDLEPDHEAVEMDRYHRLLDERYHYEPIREEEKFENIWSDDEGDTKDYQAESLTVADMALDPIMFTTFAFICVNFISILYYATLTFFLRVPRYGPLLFKLLIIFFSIVLWYFSLLMPVALCCAGSLMFVDHNKLKTKISDFVTVSADRYVERGLTKASVELRRQFVPENPFVNTDWALYAKVIGGVTVSALVVTWILKRSAEYLSQASVYAKPADANIKLGKWEDLMKCSSSVKRVKNKRIPDAWNLQKKVNPIAHAFNGNLAEFNNMASRNCRRIRCVAGSSTIKTYIYGVKGTYALMNAHCFANVDTVEMEISTTGIFNDVKGSLLTLNRDSCIELGDDMLLFDTHKIHFKDVTKHFANDVPEVGFVMLSENKGRGQHVRNSVDVEDGYDGYTLSHHIKYDIHTADGMCGLPLTMQISTTGCCIMGIHSAGARGGISTVLRKQRLCEAISKLEEKDFLMPLVSQGDFVHDMQDPLPKSFVHYEDMSFIDYYGRIPGKTMVNRKSTLTKSGVSSELREYFSDNLNFSPQEVYAPPMMQPKMHKGEYLCGVNIGVRKMNKDPPVLDQRILQICVDQLTERLVSGLEERGVKELKPLTFDEAINGAVSNPYIRSISASKSAGFGFRGAKALYIPLVEDYKSDEFQDFREMTSGMKERISVIIDTYDNEQTANFIFSGMYKDEPRLLAKCLSGATRLFYAQSLDGLIVSRMFLAPFYSLMTEFGNLFCTAVGMNMYTDADDFVHRLIDHSPYIMEGDYSGFDVSNPIGISRGAATVVYRVLVHKGYSKPALKSVQCVLTDGLFPKVELFNDLICKPGMQPSGKYATAEDNSLRGLLMLMYVWYVNSELEDRNFFEHVVPVTYGDDLLASVSEEVKHLYNNNTYQFGCSEYLKMKFTTASKSTQMDDFMTVETMSFLKRKFVYNAFLDKWEARLDMESMFKAMQWTLPSDSMTEEMQTVSTCTSMCWEMYFHLRVEVNYRDARNKMIDMLVKVYGGEVSFYHERLPTFRAIHERIYPGSEEYDGFMDTREIASVKSEGDRVLEPMTTRGYLARFGITSFNKYEIPNFEHFMVYVERECANQWHAGKLRLLEYQDLLNTELLVIQKMQAERYSDNYINLETLAKDSRVYSTLEKKEFRTRHSLASREKSILSTLEFISKKTADKSTIYEPYVAQADVQPSSGVPSVEIVTENLTDMGNMEIKTAEFSTPLHQGEAEIMKLQGFMNRPVIIDDFAVGVGSSVFKAYKLWDLLTLDSALRSKLLNYAYLRANIHVKLIVTGTPFHYGKLLMSYQPFSTRNINLDAHATARSLYPVLARDSFNCYLSSNDLSKELSINENVHVEMEIPFISTKAMHRLYNDDAAVISSLNSYDDLIDAGALYLTSLNDVETNSDVGTAINVKIIAWFEEVQLGTLTGTIAQAQSENGDDERVVGPVERVASSMLSVSEALTDVAFLKPYAMASTYIFRGLRGLSAHYGWSKPHIITNPQIVKNQPFQNGSSSIGMDTVKKISIDPKQELTVDPRVAAVETDEMIIANLASKEAFLTKFAWTDSDANNTLLWRSKVTPQLGAWFQDVTLRKIFTPTPMAYAVAPFEYWRGDVKFRIEVVCSGFHRGKLGIFYEPNIPQADLIQADFNLNKNFTHVLDLSESQGESFCIEWASPNPWLKVAPADVLDTFYGDSFATTSYANRYCNGYIGVYVFNELTSPNGNDIEINVWVSCDGMMVNQLSSRNMPTERLIAQSDRSDKSEVAVECVTLNRSTASTEHISQVCFGEQPISFRAAIKRAVTTDRLIVDDAPASEHVLRGIVKVIPLPSPTYGEILQTEPNLIQYLPLAFMGVRGGIKKRVRFWSEGVNNLTGPTARVNVTLASPSETFSDSLTWTKDIVEMSMRGTVAFVPDTNGGVEVALPFYTNNLFVFSFCDDYVGDGNVHEDMETEWTKSIVVESEMRLSNATENHMIVDSYADEDFSFLRFMGAPSYSYL